MYAACVMSRAHGLVLGLSLAVTACGASGDDSAGSAGAPTTPASGTLAGGSGAAAYPAASTRCVDTINRYRSTLGLPAYRRGSSTEACADGQAKSDALAKAAHGAFGTCHEHAQNECPGYSGTPDTMIDRCLDMMWKEGPGGGHYENMADRAYTEVTCGFYVTADGKVWAVQNFR